MLETGTIRRPRRRPSFGDDRRDHGRERVYRKPSRSPLRRRWMGGSRRLVRRDIETRPVRRTALWSADVVVHAAAKTRAPSSGSFTTRNVTLTAENGCRSARRRGVGRFVFVSSLAAVGPATSLETSIDEATTPAPLEAYG